MKKLTYYFIIGLCISLVSVNSLLDGKTVKDTPKKTIKSTQTPKTQITAAIVTNTGKNFAIADFYEGRPFDDMPPAIVPTNLHKHYKRAYTEQYATHLGLKTGSADARAGKIYNPVMPTNLLPVNAQSTYTENYGHQYALIASNKAIFDSKGQSYNNTPPPGLSTADQNTFKDNYNTMYASIAGSNAGEADAQAGKPASTILPPEILAMRLEQQKAYIDNYNFRHKNTTQDPQEDATDLGSRSGGSDGFTNKPFNNIPPTTISAESQSDYQKAYGEAYAGAIAQNVSKTDVTANKPFNNTPPSNLPDTCVARYKDVYGRGYALEAAQKTGWSDANAGKPYNNKTPSKLPTAFQAFYKSLYDGCYANAAGAKAGEADSKAGKLARDIPPAGLSTEGQSTYKDMYNASYQENIQRN